MYHGSLSVGCTLTTGVAFVNRIGENILRSVSKERVTEISERRKLGRVAVGWVRIRVSAYAHFAGRVMTSKGGSWEISSGRAEQAFGLILCKKLKQLKEMRKKKLNSSSHMNRVHYVYVYIYSQPDAHRSSELINSISLA